MAKIEIIEFDKFPIWNKQSGEDDNVFLIFKTFFLPQIKGSLLAAYRAYLHSMDKADKGRNKIAPKDAPNSWKLDCERFRWRERHRAYWRKMSHDNLQWQQERLRELQEVELILSQRLLERANDLLNLPVNPNSDKIKDATNLIRTASDISRKALGQDNLNAAIALVLRNGYELTDPTLNLLELENNLGDQK